jgi:hypothetical protein
MGYSNPSLISVVVKDNSLDMLIIRFTRHRESPITHQHTYAWGYGQVRKSLPARLSIEDAARQLGHALRATPHWEKAAKIEIHIVDCQDTECLCVTLGVSEPG